MSAPLKAVLLTPVDSVLSISTTLKFAWKPSYPAIENYQIEISDSANFAASYTDSTLTTTKLSLNTSLLPQSHTLYWRVRAKNSKGWGEYSSSYTIINTLISSVKKVTPATSDFNFLYNPKSKTINFSLTQNTSESWFITVNDINGRQLLSDVLQKGIINFEMQAGVLKSGIYIVTATNSQYSYSQKIVVE
jgi:hypothetical protein